ncbi:hypothetical protein EAS54_32210 [Bradyrhizobium guangzhouense]|nr:hypothetical protein EAS54_32210 [Bradyrhizobium guangzhouense]
MSTDRLPDDILRSIREQLSSSPLALSSGLETLSDHSLLHSYENIRREVEADKALGLRYRLIGDAAKRRAEMLQAEMVRRGIRFNPIVWP